MGFYGVMVSTQDSESCDPSSNLGRTLYFLSTDYVVYPCIIAMIAQLGER